MSDLDDGAVTFDPRDLHRDKAFDENEPNYLWCLHCERAYLRGKFRNIAGLQMCPYAKCSGDTVIDAWDWDSVRENNPTYPEMPIDNVVYPLHGEKL